MLKLKKIEVGSWPMNCYLLICAETKHSAVFDPGAESEKILSHAKGTEIKKIVLTHGHQDHVGALEELKNLTSAPILASPADAEHFNIDYDTPIYDQDTLTVGNHVITAIHTPGHSPGQMCFDLGDNRILVGDTIFVGGPGRTWSPQDFATTMKTMQEVVFQWPDETKFFPGHGPAGQIGSERPAFETFIRKGWKKNLHGDVTWT